MAHCCCCWGCPGGPQHDAATPNRANAVRSEQSWLRGAPDTRSSRLSAAEANADRLPSFPLLCFLIGVILGFRRYVQGGSLPRRPRLSLSTFALRMIPVQFWYVQHHTYRTYCCHVRSVVACCYRGTVLRYYALQYISLSHRRTTMSGKQTHYSHP